MRVIVKTCAAIRILIISLSCACFLSRSVSLSCTRARTRARALSLSLPLSLALSLSLSLARSLSLSLSLSLPLSLSLSLCLSVSLTHTLSLYSRSLCPPNPPLLTQIRTHTHAEVGGVDREIHKAGCGQTNITPVSRTSSPTSCDSCLRLFSDTTLKHSQTDLVANTVGARSCAWCHWVSRST